MDRRGAVLVANKWDIVTEEAAIVLSLPGQRVIRFHLGRPLVPRQDMEWHGLASRGSARQAIEAAKARREPLRASSDLECVQRRSGVRNGARDFLRRGATVWASRQEPIH